MITLADKFEEYAGTKEYHGIVAVIQRWFYGEMIRASWCATSVSYFAELLGILGQLGGKNENVYEMMMDCRQANAETGRGLFLYRRDIPRGAVLKRGCVIFMLNDGSVMTAGSNKHVTSSGASVVYIGSGAFIGIGGNQSDAIMPKTYSQQKIYAVFYPVYGKDPRDFVADLYAGALGRTGEAAGAAWWKKGLTVQTLTGIRAAQDFYLGQEYASRRRTDPEFLVDLYHGLLGREPDKGGYDYWLGRMAGGRMERKDVLKGFCVSAEFLNRCNSFEISRGTWTE